MAQQIIKGIAKLADLLKNKKYLLVCDSSFPFLPIKDQFDTEIQFSEFTPNPLYEQVCKGVVLFNEKKCDSIVAIGGGSTIDVAKCIKLYCKMDSNRNYLEQEKVDTGVPLIVIPTTAGTGSESTRHAVIYFEGVKQSISHPSIVPDYAVLEPSVLKTLPIYQKKCTMLDALCQGIESWWSVNSTDESKVYSKKAVQLIKDHWKTYIEQNTSLDEIMEAANYAGRAINITATTAAHAMSYKLTSMYKLPHGHAVAVCMKEVWGYMIGHIDNSIELRGKEYLKCIFSDISQIVDLEWFCKLMESLEMSYPSSENREEDIKLLTASVNPIRLKNNPVALSSEVLQRMYERIVR